MAACWSDKGKLAERRGRKATGLRDFSYDSGVAMMIEMVRKVFRAFSIAFIDVPSLSADAVSGD